MQKFLRTLTLLALICVPWVVQAQNTQTFGFEDNAIPAGWTNDATYPWTVVSTSPNNGHSGTYCIKSGNAGVGSSSSSISATFTFYDDGTITFKGGCWGEGTSTAWDKCIFEIDGVQKFANGALAAWNIYSFQVTAGTHTFTWKYTKDSSVNPTGDAFFVDSVVVDLGAIPSCYPVSDLHFDNVASNSIDLVWADTNNNGATYSVYKITGTDTVLVPASDVTINGTTATISGLLPNTLYTFGVVAECGTDGLSRLVTATERTACSPLIPLPITENFDGMGTGSGYRPFCWSVLKANGNNPYLSATHHSGNASYYFSASQNDTIFVATPMMDATLNALHVRFWAYCSNYGRLQVGVMSDTSDLSTFQPMFFLNGNGSTWNEYEFYTDTANATGSGFVVFRYTGSSSSSYSCYIDDVSITEATDCRAPVSTWVEGKTHNSITLAWENYIAPTGYEVRYDTVNNLNSLTGESITVPGSDTTVTISGLLGHTTYYAWIRPSCSSDSSDWRTFSATTTNYSCYAVTGLSVAAANSSNIALTWNYDAEGRGEAPTGVNLYYKDLTDTTVAPVDTMVTGNMALIGGLAMGHNYQFKARTLCGDNDTANVTTLTYTIPNCGELLGGSTTTSSFPFNGYYKYSYSQVIYPASVIAGMSSISGVSFQNNNSSVNFDFDLEVYVGFTSQASLTASTYIPASNQTLASDGTLHVSGSGWVTIPFTTPISVTPGQNIVLTVVNKTGNYTSYSGYPTWTAHSGGTGLYLSSDLEEYDASSITSPSSSTTVPDIKFVGNCASDCEAPVVMASNATENTIDLTWTSGEETSWSVRYKVAGTDEWTVIDGLTSTSTTIDNLAAGTYYYFSAAAECANDTMWSGNITAHTLCADNVTLPYYTGFEGLPTNQMPLCWTRSNQGSAYVSSSYAAEGSRSLYLYSTSAQKVYAATPMFDADATELEVVFKGRFSNSMTKVEAGLMTDPTDASTFEPMWTLSQGNGNTFTEYLFYTANSTISSGTPVCVAFRYDGNGNVAYVDSLVVNISAGCQKPTDVVVTGVTHNQAVINWVGLEDATYGIHIDTVATLTDEAIDDYTVSDTTYTLNEGLEPHTRYYVWVRNVCGGVTSDWTTPVTFRTTMEGAPLPYSTGFEGDSLDWVIDNGTQTNGWYCGTAANNGGTKALYISNDQGVSNSYGNSSTSYVVAFKTFSLTDTGTYAITYDWKANAETCCDYLRVLLAPGSMEPVAGQSNGIGSSGAPAGWMSLDGGSKLNGQSNWQSAFYTCHVTEPGNYNLVLYWYNDYSTGSNPPAAVDNLQFGYLSCPQPTNLDTSNLTTTSVHLHWVSNGSETAWLVRANGGDWQSVNDTAYDLTTLQSSTSYLIEVVADCGEGDTSFAASISFRTKDLCPRVTNLRLLSVSTDTATFTWTNAVVGEWVYEYGPVGFAIGTGITGTVDDTNCLVLRNLADATNYEFRLWSSCTEGNSDTANVFFSTRGLPVELPYSTGFEITDDCAWDFANGTETNKWFIGNATNNGGSRALYISNDNGESNAYNVSNSTNVYAYREIHIAEEGDYTVSYDWKTLGESSFDYLRVYMVPASVTPNAGSTASSSWYALAPTQNGFEEWQHYAAERTFNIADTGIYKLVFLWHNDASGGSQPPAAVDNVVVRKITCPNIHNLAATGITSTTANLKWNARQATAWVVEYDTVGFTLGNGTRVAVTDSVYTITGLTASTAYTAYVAAVCPGNDTGTFSSVTFRTIASAATLPYSTSFEAGQDVDWSFFNGNNAWMVGTATHSTADTGTHAMYISNNGTANTYSMGSTSMSYAYRQVNVETPGEYFCTFDWKGKGYSSYDYMRAWLVPADSFNVAANLLPDGTNYTYGYQTTTPDGWIDLGGKMNNKNDWQSTINPITITNTGRYNLVFMWANYSYTGGSNPPAAVDNIWFGMPTCPWVQNVGVDSASVADSTIYFSWTPGSTETAWAVQYGNSIDTVTVPQYALQHLIGTSANRYTIKVRSLCSDEDQSFWKEISGHLPCTPDTVPFLNDFDNLSGTFTNNCWGIGNSAGQAQNGYNNWPSCVSFTGASNDKLLFLNKGAYVILPDLNMPLNQLYLTFDFSSGADSSVLYLGYATNTQSAFSKVVFFDTLYHVDYATEAEFRGRVEMLLSNLPAEAHNLVIASDVIGTGYYVGLNELNLTLPPACGHVENVVATPVSETSVTLSWSAPVFGVAQEYIVEYGPRPYTPGTGIMDTINTNSITLTGLRAMTPYEAYVTTICTQGDTSVATMPIAFAGNCGNISVPDTFTFSEYLMSGRSLTGVMPNCWVIDSASRIYSEDSILAQVYGANSNTEMTFLMYDQSVVALPAVNMPLDTLMLTFDMQIADPSMALVIGAVSSQANGFGTTFVPIDTLRYRDNGTVTSYLATYAGNYQYIAFKNVALDTTVDAAYVAIDNLVISVAPTCLPIRRLEVVNAEETSITINWDDIVSAGNWAVEYGPRGFATGSGTVMNVTSHPVTISGLASATAYDIYVTPVCSATNHGDTASLSASTTCAIVTSFPWTEGFETASNFVCWSQSGDGEWTRGSGASGSVTSAHSGSSNAKITHSNRGDVTMLISPVLALAPDVPSTLSFWHTQQQWSGDQDELRVYYRTAQTDTWHLLMVFTDNIDAWTKDSVLLPNTSATYQIAFEMTDAYGHGVALDDITISGVGSSCNAPIALTVDTVAETYATIHWSGDATSYEVAIIEDSVWTDPTTGIISLDDSTKTFTDLTAGTQYVVGVRTVCENGGTSAWVTRAITTLEHPCLMPTNVTISNVTLTSASIDWTPAETTHGRWAVKITGPGCNILDTVTSHPYSVSDLTANTTYNVQVMTVCSDERGSDFTEAETFTTTVCQPVTGLATGTVTATTAVLNWNAVAGSTGRYEVNYGMAGFPQGTGEVVTVNGTTTVTLEGLQSETMYDAYVRVYCAEGVASNWSTKVTFETSRVGINDVDGNAISLFPNPASTTVTLTGIEGAATVTVVDMNGRETGKWNVENGKLTIDVSDLAQGAYFVRITGEQVNAIRKLIVR
jgi:hypothetical protein